MTGQEYITVNAEVLFGWIREELESGRSAAFSISGMSMWPFLCHSRDQVILSPLQRSLKTGDIVLLQKPEGDYILHRITAIRGNEVRTTGDGKTSHDGWFPMSSVIGIVTAVTRKRKKIACDQWEWKLLVRIWMVLYPVRGLLLSALRGISRWKYK